MRRYIRKEIKWVREVKNKTRDCKKTDINKIKNKKKEEQTRYKTD